MHIADTPLLGRILNSRLGKRVSKYLKYRLFWPVELRFMWLRSDESYTRRIYREVFHRELNLENPQTFCEKMNYLKLYYRPPLLTRLVDKYAVRDYVREKGFGYILNEVYGTYNRVEDIPFHSLPNAFVAKVTHGSGWNVICTDKSKLDWKTESRNLKKWLKTDFFSMYREWAYRDVPRRVMIEKYLQSPDGFTPNDYKVYCFNGKVGFIQVDVDRFGDHTRTLYTLEWEPIPVTLLNMPNDRIVPRPQNLDEMLEISRVLSDGLPLARIDLYSIHNKILFSEITIYAGAGFITFQPEEYDAIFGTMLDISGIPRQ